MIDNRTPNLDLPLPHANNLLEEDAPRLASSLSTLDAALIESVTVGMAVGWSLTPSGGTAEEPAQFLWAKGTQAVKAVLTWASGKVTQAVFSKSGDTGATWSPIGTQVIAYDANDNVTGVTWA